MVSADRRSVLHMIGATAIAGLAGCNSSEDETPNGTGQSGADTTDDEAATDEDTTGPLEMEEVATGNIGHAAGVNGTLTYTTDGNRKRIVYGDTEYPAFDDISRGQAPQRNEYISVNNGTAYRGREANGTIKEVIMAGDVELYSETFETNADPNYVPPSATLWDGLDGEPIWSEATAQKYHSSFRIGDEVVDPDFDGVSHVRSIGGEIAYVGWDKDENDRWDSQELVKGGSTMNSFGSDEAFAPGRPLEDIDGTPTFVKLTRSGDVIQYGDREVGSEYTERGGGDFPWIGELNGSLAFIANVARDNIEGNRPREQALWFDGEEVDRARSLGTGGMGIAHTDEGLAYSFDDDDTTGIKIGDRLEEYVASPSNVASVNGTPAYDAPGEEGNIVIYGDQKTEPQYLVLEIFEVDGDLGYLAQTEDGVPDSDVIYREA